jgi:hypothetical protein
LEIGTDPFEREVITVKEFNVLERNKFKRDTDLGLLNEVLTILKFLLIGFHKVVDLCWEHGLGMIFASQILFYFQYFKMNCEFLFNVVKSISRLVKEQSIITPVPHLCEVAEVIGKLLEMGLYMRMILHYQAIGISKLCFHSTKTSQKKGLLSRNFKLSQLIHAVPCEIGTLLCFIRP